MTVTNTSYCTSAQVKDFLDIEDSVDDTRITQSIAATTQAIDHLTGQFFWNDDTASARAFYPSDPHRLWVPPFHTTTGLVVKVDTGSNGTYDTTWTATTDYVVDPPGGYNSGGGETVAYHALRAAGSRHFPVDARRPRVQITAAWGWADIPDSVQEAAIIKASRLLKRSEAPFGTIGGGDFGVVRISRHEDPDVLSLLADYIRPGHRPVVM